MLTPGTLFSSDFRVESPLSSGGMGSVYVATQLSTGRRRALKLMHPDLVKDPKLQERFALEAQVGARIDSEHVVEVIAAGVDPKTASPFLVMELLEGETLSAHMGRCGPLPPREVADLFRQLCHAMGAAHSAAIIHRDLKPDNVFLSKSRRADVRFTVKVLDFGIAKLLAEAHTAKTAAMGTPMWMAPEQTEPGATVTPSADVWALALIAFRALSGKPYWRSGLGGSVQQVMREVLFEPMVPASERAAALGAAPLPVGFDAWFRRATLRDPALRFSNAHRAFDDLAPILDGTAQPRDVASTFGSAPVSTAFEQGGRAELESRRNPPEPVMPLTAQIVTGPGALAPTQRAKQSAAIWIVGGLLALAAIGVALFFALRTPEKPLRARLADDDDEPRRARSAEIGSTAAPGWQQPGSIPVSSRDPQLGAKDAPITIVAFMNVECTHCRKVHPTLDALRERYGKDLRLVWKDFCLPHEARSRPAAIVARSVFLEKGSDAFYKTIHQATGGPIEDADKASLELWASKNVGVEPKAFDKRLSEAEKIVDEQKALAEKLRLDGAPAFYINGILQTGAAPLETFTKLIDDELSAVEAAKKAGLKADAVYEARVLANYKLLVSKPVVSAHEDKPFAVAVVAGQSPAKGPADAPIVVVEFSEFQCPFCRKVAPTLKRLQEARALDVKLVFKHRLFPSHDRCIPAGNIAFEARKKSGDTGFWNAVDLLTAPEAAKLDDAALSSVASKLGLGPSALACANSNCNKAELELVDREATAAGVNGIPHMFVNGRAVGGAQPYELFESVVDWERAKLALHVEKGGSRADYQAASIARNRLLSGMTVRDTERGLGAHAAAGKKLTIHYRGNLPGGKEFDSSYARQRPLVTTLKPGQFVIGFEEGLIGMREGGKRTISLPPDAHYGPQGKPPAVPANTVLTFDLELLKVE